MTLCAGMMLAGENLLRNGSFDEGETTALHWEAADGLTTFYKMEEGRGRIVCLDTLVQREQALEWAKAFKADPTLKAPAKKPIAPDSYGSIGGNEGVMLDSELIQVKPGQDYKLTADFRGDGKPFIWIKGFLTHPKRKTLVDGYQTRLEPASPAKPSGAPSRSASTPPPNLRALRNSKSGSMRTGPMASTTLTTSALKRSPPKRWPSW